MTQHEVIETLRQMAAELGSQKDLATQLGIAPSYLSDVMAGNREPGDKILSQLGLAVEKHYVPRRSSTRKTA